MAGARVYGGIDPGLTGAVAWLSAEGRYLGGGLTPTVGREYNLRGMVELLSVPFADDALVEGHEVLVRVAVEKVHSMPKQGVSSTFKFGMGYGIWLGMLSALMLSYQLVPPLTWQRAMLRGCPRGQSKVYSLTTAQALWPTAPLSRKKDHGLADALLMAEWLRREEVGK